MKKIINVEFDGVDYKDYPDFCDAFVSYAEHEDGTPLTEVELDSFNEVSKDIVHQLLWEHIH